MPSSIETTKSERERPTSDIFLEAGRRYLTEVEKSTVADSNKQVSMMLARSRSLDVLSSPVLEAPKKIYDSNDDDDTSSLSISDESSSTSNKSAGLLKEETSSTISNSSSTLKKVSSLPKEKSELNNNNHNNNESYRNSSSRSSSISTRSSSSSNYSASSNHSKLQRRTSSTTTDGAAAFQEVVLNEPIRITGYLEKRSKVLGWKKFWFVLDGRLLTYYKSKTDYESLSACCGCINLGIASIVRPIQLRGCKGYPLQIVTRSQVYYLRSPEKPVLEQWLLAIQEAASSPPSSSALTSWLSCSGSQYFRQSFTSQSQWSLNNSSEDIADISSRLGNLPDTFYERRDKGSLIYPSPPTLSQPSPIIHKCHSFASLQTSVVSCYGGREGLYGRRVLLSSTENLRDLQDVKRNNRVKSATMQHSTSLLVLDSSPQAAELRKELTRKLSGGSNTNTSSSNKTEGEKDGSSGSNDVPTPKFLLLSAKKKSNTGQCAEGVPDEESHHYDEIGDFVGGKPHYENSIVEKLNGGGGGSQPNSARNSMRGESAEKESNIYEHVDTSEATTLKLDHSLPAQVLWEPINDPSCANLNKRFPQHRLSAGSNRNSLVSISEVPEDISSTSPSPIKTPVLSSIPESSWLSSIEPFKGYGKPYSSDELSSCRSESFRSLPCAEKIGKKRKGKAAIGGFFAKVFGKNKGKGSKSDSKESQQKQMIITGPIDLRKQTQMQELPERKPPPSYPFKKTSIPKNTSPNVSIQQDQQQQEQAEVLKSSPTIPGSRMTINNTNVMDELKQKVGHITLKRTNSRSSSGSDTELSPPKEPAKSNDIPSPSVEARVPYVPRAHTTTSASTEAIKPAPVLIFQMQGSKCESNTDDDNANADNKSEEQTASISISPEWESTNSEGGTLPRPEIVSKVEDKIIPPPPPMPQYNNEVDQVDSSKATKQQTANANQQLPPIVNKKIHKNNPETDFQNKLAKFNRLSQTLSANFIAALHPLNTNSSASSINRSQSYKATKAKNNVIRNLRNEALPPLPPKKKNAGGMISASTGAIALYDVPSNNRPVPNKRPQISTDNLDKCQPICEERTIAAYIRDLTKKNSTPDIVLSGNSSNSICLRDVMTDVKDFRQTLDSSSDESLNGYRSSPSTPPGRPPKPKPPVKPKPSELGQRIKRTSESSTSSEGSFDQSQTTPTPILPSHILTNTLRNSPATSDKSINIDSIDVLSDEGLSDTKASDSSSDPESLKVCQCHTLPDDFGFSTDAKTPESVVSSIDKFVPDSLAGTPNTEITFGSSSASENFPEIGNVDSDVEPLSINKLEIVIRDNDGSPGLIIPSPDTESRLDSLERRPGKSVSVTPTNSESVPSAVYQNLKFATVNTLIQEFETVEENEDEMSELYDDFPSEFYTPTPSSFSGYSPSDVSTTPSDSSPVSIPSSLKKHARIDAIRHSGMEQLEAFLNFGGTPTSDDCSFESCVDSFSEDGSKSSSGTSTTSIPHQQNHHHHNNNIINNTNSVKNSPFLAGPQQIHNNSQVSGSVIGGGINRTGAISRLGHSSAVGHLQKILTNDVK